MLSIEYISLVKQDFENKRDSNDLPLSLMKPTPASLKEECLAVCNARYHKKDERALTAFFGNGNDKAACLQAIKRCPRDKFRPLVTYLKDGTESPNFKIIELLAWLIDYKERPWVFAPTTTPESPKIGPPIESEPSIETPLEPPQQGPIKIKEKQRPNTRRIQIIVTVTIVLAGIGVYPLWPHKHQPPGSLAPQACMQWVDDHYAQVPCNQAKEGVIPLDSQKFIHLKKITRQDTITENAIHHVWYVKYNRNIEFYTDSGFHPIYQQYRLLPITKYIINKYIHHDQVAEKNSN